MARQVREKPPQRYVPVQFEPEKYAARRSRVDPAFREAWREIADEFAALDVLLQVRLSAGLTQAEIARRMGVKPSALARIEASIISRKHSPSVQTLRKYAAACGKRLAISIV